MEPNDELKEMATVDAEAGEDISVKPRKRLKELIERGRNCILVGPPGTGKTKLVLDARDDLESLNDLGEFKLVQFHREFSYQDFIDGYKPTETGFAYQPGVFRQFLEAVEKRRDTDGDEKKIDLFAIDEINRANVSSVFGEVLTILDDPERKQVIPPRSGMPLVLYDSVMILGTMNSADKSIALVDFALRRRFSFVFVPPDYDGLRAWLLEYGFEFSEFSIEDYVNAISQLNERIEMHPRLGKEMTLGQSFFVPKKKEKAPITLREIAETLSEEAFPQVEAYFGRGSYREMDQILAPNIRQKITGADQITEEDIVGLIRVLNADQASA